MLYSHLRVQVIDVSDEKSNDIVSHPPVLRSLKNSSISLKFYLPQMEGNSNVHGLVSRMGSQRYVVEGNQRASHQRHSFLDAGSVKRVNTPSSFPSLTNKQASTQRYVANNGRLVQTFANSSPIHSGQSLKRSFMPDYHCDFNQRFAKSMDSKSKGLRHFSTKVCEKVKEKGRTNYNEVADELVAEYFDSLSMPLADSDKQTYDMKNIRRRVYDALNVLMAMNIIEKEKKEIRWVGLPTSSLQECRRLEEEKAKKAERIKEKTETLYDLVMQLVAYKSLVERNRERERVEGRPPENSIIYLPYVVVTTDKRTCVECNISADKTEYVFNFDHPFEIQDDIEVLKRLGLAHGLERGDVPEEVRPNIKAYLPAALRPYVDPIINNAFSLRLQQQQQLAQRASFERKVAAPSGMGSGRQVVRVAARPPAVTTVTAPRYRPVPGGTSFTASTGSRYGPPRSVPSHHPKPPAPPSLYTPAPAYNGAKQYLPPRHASSSSYSMRPPQVEERYEEEYEEEEENVDYE